MNVAEKLPTLDDQSLATLRSNASRLESAGKGPRQKEAADLLPLIDAELAMRAAAKPKPVRATRKKAAIPDAGTPGAD